jgi:predicted ATPase/class 3 adenylate cyclase
MITSTMPRDLPSGTVTFLFTDIEGSTKLLHELGPEAYARALSEHRHILRQVFTAHQGVEVDTQGDAFFVAFPMASEGLKAAAEAQERLASGPIRVRMGLHTGRPHLGDEGYVGHDVHKGARIASSAHGGQVVLSRETRELAGDAFSLTDLGEHRVKDFVEPVWIFQLGNTSFPPLKTISNTNLPHPASSFVGREREVMEVASLLRQETRLLTLTGPGGIGKSRLAIEAAAELVPGFDSGVFWVGLAALRDPALVTQTISQSLGAKDGLAEHIGERRMLLVLDNLEQVITSAPQLASVVEACPNLKLLVTSRQLLRVRGEVEYAVPPLADPEAIDLFCARSRLDRDEIIAELCRELDNLALAIELAAARVKVLTPAQILDRLSRRLDLLKGGQDADARQATLRATIGWSYDLLTAEEKRLFACLAVFSGGCTLQAAEEVAVADLDVLESLANKSLVRRTGDRFWMLETIREYAAERLVEAEEREGLRRRHAEFLSKHHREPTRMQRTAWIAALEGDRDNLRAAMRWAVDARESETSLHLANAYAALCKHHGPVTEGRTWLDAALAIDEGSSSATRVRALLGAASLAQMQGDLERAGAFAETSLSLARSVGDAEDIGHALVMLGIIAQDEKRHDSSESLLREALAVFRGCGNESEVRDTLGLLGFDAIARNDYEEARSVLEEAIDLSRETEDSWSLLRGVSNLAYVLAQQGRRKDALPLLRESLLLAHELSDLLAVACQLEDVAAVTVQLRDYERAAVIMGGAAAVLERTGHTFEPVQQAQHYETVSILRNELEAKRFAQAWDSGTKMSPGELVTYAADFIDSAS